MNLRPYQSDSVKSLFDYFEDNDGNPIVCVPTGGGKSIIQAAFIKETLDKWPSERFLLVSHVKELLIQNEEKIKRLLPDVSIGIYSAGLGQKNTGQITIAGIQSCYQKAHELGDISIAIVDECHLISKHNDTMYRKFFDSLRRFCPHVKIIGLSATPFRLDSGPLIKGSNRLFTDIAYSISIKELINDGFLCSITNQKTVSRPDLSSVEKRGGEYVPGQLESAVNIDSLTQAAINEIELYCQDRKSWLVFCAGVQHAHDVCKALNARGHASEIVIGETEKSEREKRINDFKEKKIKALVSVGVLTTGFDAPNADALVCLRPTCSPGLWMQMVGRITRLCDGKKDGLVLDFTDNTKTHGPIDLISIDSDGEVKSKLQKICLFCGEIIEGNGSVCDKCGQIQVKPCPACKNMMPIKSRFCDNCEFCIPIQEREIKHGETAYFDEPILSGYDGAWTISKVKSWKFFTHKKAGSKDSLKVNYEIDLTNNFNEWICIEHGGYAGDKASRWWIKHKGLTPTPKTVIEALERVNELKLPDSIKIKRNGKFINVA